MGVQSQIFFESFLLESETQKDLKLLELLRARQGNAVICCSTPNSVEYVYQYLMDHGLEALRHHKRIRSAERKAALAKFNKGRFVILLVAGGMPPELRQAPIRMMVHFNFPSSMNGYLEEVRVIGGSHLPARCTLLFLRKDKRTQKCDPLALREVTVYAQSAMCRTRTLARLAKTPFEGVSCQSCDNCLRGTRPKPVRTIPLLDLDVLTNPSS